MSLINKLRQGANFLYENSPAAWAMRNSEAMQLRAESREKDYNSPKAQMNRYKEAGLNPALIYGGGSSGASGNVGAKAPQAQAPGLAISGIAQYMLQAVQTGAQIANISSQRGLRATQENVNETSIGKIEEQRDLAEAQKGLVRQQLNYLHNVNPDLADLVRARAQLMGNEAMISTQIGMEKAGQELANLLAQNGLLDADNKIRAQILQSKTIENELLKLERDFIADGDFNAKQFWQALLMFITRVKPR